MKTLLLILLFPVGAAAQFVDPIISKDYLDRLKENSKAKIFLTDTTNNAKNALLLLTGHYSGYAIERITVKKGYLRIRPASTKALFLSGSFNAGVEIKSINQLPALQNEYAQGRSMNGNLAWRGPETNELFSYGPAINTLEFDGSNYAYDVNGKLVTAGSGNGQKAKVYKNGIFRTASLLSQSLSVQGRYATKGNQYLARIKLGQSTENTFIKYNKNVSKNFSTFFEATIRKFIVSATYSHLTDKFSNSNRNGFLNRVYQNSILSPISFDNTQGNFVGNGQRSYSDAADNPIFLLEDNGNSFFQSHKMGNVVIEKKVGDFKFRIAQSADKTEENSKEGYKPGTAFFQNGVFINRKKRNSNYVLSARSTYEVDYNKYNFRSTASVNYIFDNARSRIDYQTRAYNYRRSSHDLELNYLTIFDGDDIDAGMRLSNKFYASNTTLKNDFFLPGLSGYITFNNIFNANGLWAKLASNFSNFNSEAPVSSSFAQYNLTRYSTEEAFQYFPATEVNSLNSLLPVRHKEWTVRAEIYYRNKISFEAEIFNRKIFDDVFPVYENGSPVLKNIADHRNKGIELTFTHNVHGKKVTTNNSLSLFHYRDIVTDVKDGYHFTPYAGFRNINKAIVNGEVLGAITGNRFLRDEASHIVIGNDGFPLADPNPSVIGDPTPDFVLKISNSLGWKEFSVNFDWEWKKGGDIWNGTQAVLDFYGRSATSAQLRNTTGYVFAGVFADGHPNNIAVNFYDPNSSFQSNRWVRYGHTGIAEEYIQRGDHIRINNIGLNYKLKARKYIQTIAFTLSASNIIVWSAYKGADPNQLLFDQSDTNGLDFFNLPSVKNFAFNISIQF